MIGIVAIVLVLVVVIPLLVWVAAGVIAAVMGSALKNNAEATHPGSDLIETNY